MSIVLSGNSVVNKRDEACGGKQHHKQAKMNKNTYKYFALIQFTDIQTDRQTDRYIYSKDIIILCTRSQTEPEVITGRLLLMTHLQK